MATAKISGKGWIVIPKELRDKYGIKPGDRVHVVDYRGIAIIPAMKDPIRDALGMLQDGPSLTEALVEDRRREREREDAKSRRWTQKAKGKAKARA